MNQTNIFLSIFLIWHCVYDFHGKLRLLSGQQECTVHLSLLISYVSDAIQNYQHICRLVEMIYHPMYPSDTLAKGTECNPTLRAIFLPPRHHIIMTLLPNAQHSTPESGLNRAYPSAPSFPLPWRIVSFLSDALLAPPPSPSCPGTFG